MQMLARQASLLIAKSAAYRRQGLLDAAMVIADEATSLIDGLRSRANRQDVKLASDLEGWWFEAQCAAGLAQVERRDLVAARKILRSLQRQLQTARDSNMPTAHVVRLEQALDDEAQERFASKDRFKRTRCRVLSCSGCHGEGKRAFEKPILRVARSTPRTLDAPAISTRGLDRLRQKITHQEVGHGYRPDLVRARRTGTRAVGGVMPSV